MGRTCSTHGKMKRKKSEEKRQIERHRHRWEDIMKWMLKE